MVTVTHSSVRNGGSLFTRSTSAGTGSIVSVGLPISSTTIPGDTTVAS